MEGSLFVLCVCHIEISQTIVPPTALGTVGKPLMSRGALSWFHNILTYDKKKLFNIE